VPAPEVHGNGLPGMVLAGIRTFWTFAPAWVDV
jgi:hypothetical protein